MTREAELREAEAPCCLSMVKSPLLGSRRYAATTEHSRIEGTAATTRAKTVDTSPAPVRAWERPSSADAVRAA